MLSEFHLWHRHLDSAVSEMWASWPRLKAIKCVRGSDRDEDLVQIGPMSHIERTHSSKGIANKSTWRPSVPHCRDRTWRRAALESGSAKVSRHNLRPLAVLCLCQYRWKQIQGKIGLVAQYCTFNFCALFFYYMCYWIEALHRRRWLCSHWCWNWLPFSFIQRKFVTNIPRCILHVGRGEGLARNNWVIDVTAWLLSLIF